MNANNKLQTFPTKGGRGNNEFIPIGKTYVTGYKQTV